MTAATPIVMPSMVSAARSLLAASERSARLMFSSSMAERLLERGARAAGLSVVARQRRLLIAQRVDRVQGCGADGGVHTKEQADGGGKTGGQQHAVEGHRHRQVGLEQGHRLRSQRAN